jgi:putative transcriptional regulator
VTGSLRGQLLVATPDLEDPNFFRTVVLVLEHTVDGALGVVLNRPTGTEVASVLPAWAPLVTGPAGGVGAVFVGGPVQPDGAIGLARRAPSAGATDEPLGFAALFDDVGTVDLERDPGDVAPALAAARVFAGHAGWGPGQLDGEVAAHGWFVVARAGADLWETEPEDLWKRVLQRQPGRVRMFAGFPADPGLN